MLSEERPSWFDVDRELERMTGWPVRTRSLQSRIVDIVERGQVVDTGYVLDAAPGRSKRGHAFARVVRVFIFARDEEPTRIELVPIESLRLRPKVLA